MKNSGKSKSSINPQGIRRKSEGKELAPKSLRLKYKFVDHVPKDILDKVLS